MKIKFELEIEDSVFGLLEDFLKGVQNVDTVAELLLSFIKQGIGSAVQQVVHSKITVVAQEVKEAPPNKPTK